MCVKEDGTVPQFYTEYVREVQEVIKRNAALEFEAIWREHQQTGEPRSTLSDNLRIAITRLDEELQKQDLWTNQPLRNSVLEDALPDLLLKKVGLATIVERVSCNFLCGPRRSANLVGRFLKITCGQYLVATWRAASYMNSAVIPVNLPSSICELPLGYMQ